jgi:hypothetical protein
VVHNCKGTNGRGTSNDIVTLAECRRVFPGNAEDLTSDGQRRGVTILQDRVNGAHRGERKRSGEAVRAVAAAETVFVAA